MLNVMGEKEVAAQYMYMPLRLPKTNQDWDHRYESIGTSRGTSFNSNRRFVERFSFSDDYSLPKNQTVVCVPINVVYDKSWF